MKKILCLVMLMTLLLAATVSASAQQVTANGNSYENVPFSNGYFGYCIDRELHGAYVGDVFTVADSTSQATSNTTNSDISQSLKLLFTQNFATIFESNGSGDYVMKSNMVNTVLGAVYHFSEEQYVWGDQKKLTDAVKNYSGPAIPDSGYSLTLENGDVVTFDFVVLVPENAGQQTFFAYRISTKAPGEAIYNVTVTTDGNGSGSANPTSGVSGTEVTLTATPNDGYIFKEWQVISGDVTVTDDKLTIRNSDVEVKAIFEKIPDPIYNVTVTTDGNGSGSANPTSGVSGTEVTLTATPNEGYTFSRWEVISGGVTVENNDFTIANSDVEVKAYFEKIPEPVYNIIVTTDGNGSGSANPTSGVSGTEVTLTATPNDGYIFKEWQVISGGVTVTDDKLTIRNSDIEVKAIFEKIPDPIYNVTVTTDGNGSGSANPTSGVSGTEVTLTATPNDGYIFKEWQVISGDVTVTDNQLTIGNSDVEVKAFFEKIPEPIYNVTVTTDGNGSGSANPTSGVSGTEVTLTATPNDGYIFKEWQVISGGVTVTDDKLTIGNSDIEVKAIFEKIPDPIYNVTVTTDGNGSGSANPTSGVSGTEVTLTATPNAGYTFSKWEVISGGVSIENNEFSIANSDVHVKAYFEKIPEPIYNVTVTTDGNGSGSANPTSGVSGTEVTLTATPNAGYTFSKWEVVSGGVTISGGKLTIANSDVHVKAFFEKIPAATYTVTFNANGGSGTMAPQTFAEDVAQPLNRNDFTREGFTFSGWNTAPDGSGYSFADGATVTTDSDVVLYAQWKENPAVNPLLIVKQPTDQYVVEGQHAEFNVNATGDGLKYQWYINRNDGEGWKALDGAIVSEYVTSVVDKDCDGFRYGCLVGDQYGNVLKSEVAVLHVSDTPVLPETGDDSAPMLWLAMSMMSLIGIAVLRRKSYN